MNPLIGWAILSGVFVLLWLRQVRTRNATSVDAAWACSIAGLAVAYALGASDADLRTRLLVAIVPALWGLRLAGHLWWYRVRREEHEDGRYATMRETWGKKAQVGFFVTYQVQAGLAVLFSLPAWGVLNSDAASAPLVLVAVLIWIVSLTGETIADNQLAAWRANPDNAGRTCRACLVSHDEPRPCGPARSRPSSRSRRCAVRPGSPRRARGPATPRSGILTRPHARPWPGASTRS